MYQPSGEGKRRKFLDPSQQDFDRAVELYQMKQEQSSHKEKIRVPNMTTEKLQNSLENCIAAMQHYDKLEKQRIDPIYLEELSPREHESSLFEASKSGLDTLASQELEMEQKTQDYQSEVDRFLKEELGRLRQQIEETPQIPSLYVIVVLCYGLGLKQSEAETLLLINGIEIDRSSISRHLTQLKTIWVERLWDCFRDEIEPIATDEHFDRNLARWSKQRQQNVEEGLRAYLREEITDTLGQFVLPYFANRHHFENARTFWKYYLHLWSLQTLGVTLMWDTLPPDIDPKKVNKLTKRIDLFVQHSLIELAN
ncbi:MAG: hypothetical protein SWY16_14345 [Cyanobacteriota bacterium]|nr:hypothetical protein [Cyanobacteriota bacterium]